MKKLYYKVVDKDSTTQEFCSAVANNKYRNNEFNLIYRIGETTYPKIGRIFIFKNREAAENFLYRRQDDGYECWLLKGYATNIGTPKTLSASVSPGYIRAYWGTKQRNININGAFIHSAPYGSLSCSSFTPTEQVVL